jgi:hypothetical protein
VVPARHHSHRDLELVGGLSQRLVLTFAMFGSTQAKFIFMSFLDSALCYLSNPNPTQLVTFLPIGPFSTATSLRSLSPIHTIKMA